MNKFFKILSLSVFLFIFGCDNTDKKVLTIGTSADYPPFSFTNGKEIDGFDMDLAKELAKNLGYKLHIKDMAFNELISAVQKKKIDFAIAAITATPERERIVDFSMKYYKPNFSLLYNKDKPITSMKSLEDKVVAVQRGSTMEIFLKERLGILKNVKMVSFERNPLMLKDLKESKIDGILIELTEAEAFCANDNTLAYSFIHSQFDTANYAIAFPKESLLLSKVNDAMLQLKLSSEFERFNKKWFKLGSY